MADILAFYKKQARHKDGRDLYFAQQVQPQDMMVQPSSHQDTINQFVNDPAQTEEDSDSDAVQKAYLKRRAESRRIEEERIQKERAERKFKEKKAYFDKEIEGLPDFKEQEQYQHVNKNPNKDP